MRAMTSSGVRPVESITRASAAGRSGADRTARVARVPLRDVPRKVAQANINPLFFQLLMPPHCALLGGRRQEHLERGGRENHGAHVAAVRDEARRPREARCRSSSARGPPAAPPRATRPHPAASVRSAAVDVRAVEQHRSAPPSRAELTSMRAASGQAPRGRLRSAPRARRRAPTSRYSAPLSSRCQPSRAASPRLIVPLPEPLGPSIVDDRSRSLPSSGRPGARTDSSPTAVATSRKVGKRRGDLCRVEDLDRRAARAGSPRRTPWRCGDRRGCRPCRRADSAAGHAQAAGCRPRPRPRAAARPCGHDGEPVGLLRAQLLGAASRASCRARRRRRRTGPGTRRSRAARAPAARRCRVARCVERTGPRPARRRVGARTAQLDVGAHLAQDREQARCAWGSRRRSRISEPVVGAPRQAATMKNAADEKSPGTPISRPRSVAGPASDTVCPRPCSLVSTRTPMLCEHPLRVVAARAGRVHASCVLRRVERGEQIADFTCALAIGSA